MFETVAQAVINGLLIGGIYALVSIGVTLIFGVVKIVNFAQGDLMMLGGFFAFTFIAILGLNYWIGFLLAVIAMALFGMLAERLVVRPILGYPQFSIIMVTIGLGFFLRSVAGISVSVATSVMVPLAPRGVHPAC